MKLTKERTQSTARLKEVRTTLELIKRNESKDPLIGDELEVVLLRGLFYVHLYGAFEYSINICAQGALRTVGSSGAKYSELGHRFYSVALDDRFKSISTLGSSKGWPKRFELLDLQFSDTNCHINDSVFYYELQNIWPETLDDLFACFHISEDWCPDKSYRPYLKEIVEKRNQVAHGRESAETIGRGTRSPDLEKRFDAISMIVANIFDSMDTYLNEFGFVHAAHRAAYLTPPV